MSLSRFERTGTEISQHRRSAASQRGLIINTRNSGIIQFKKKYTFDGSGRCSLVLIVDLFSKNCQMGRWGLIRSWSKRYPSFDFLRWFSPVFSFFFFGIEMEIKTSTFSGKLAGHFFFILIFRNSSTCHLGTSCWNSQGILMRAFTILIQSVCLLLSRAWTFDFLSRRSSSSSSSEILRVAITALPAETARGNLEEI